MGFSPLYTQKMFSFHCFVPLHCLEYPFQPYCPSPIPQIQWFHDLKFLTTQHILMLKGTHSQTFVKWLAALMVLLSKFDLE